jgi:hypothetical protein
MDGRVGVSEEEDLPAGMPCLASKNYASTPLAEPLQAAQDALLARLAMQNLAARERPFPKKVLLRDSANMTHSAACPTAGSRIIVQSKRVRTLRYLADHRDFRQ